MLTFKRETVSFDRAQLKALQEVNAGGEGTIYVASDGTAWKIFHDPNGPYFLGDDPQTLKSKASADHKLSHVYPRKLPQFPLWLRSRVVSPHYYLKDVQSSYPIDGYAMTYLSGAEQILRYSEPEWRERPGATIDEIVRAYLSLYDTICEAHACGVLLKDLKPENVLVKQGRVYIVDGESLDFGGLDTGTFTPDYADWRLCDRSLDEPMPIQPHDRLADWYAFSVMLFEALTCVHPYAGVHRPQGGKPRFSKSQRAKRGISILDKDVVTPPFMADLNLVLTPKLREYFVKVFEQGLRMRPERALLEELIKGSPLPARLDPLSDTMWKSSPLPSTTGPADLLGLASSSLTAQGDLLCVKIVGGKAVGLSRTGSEIVRTDGTWRTEDGGLYNWFDLGPSAQLLGRCRSARQASVVDGPFHLLRVSGAPGCEIPNVSRGLSQKPNIALQEDRAYWLCNERLYASHTTECLAEIPGSEVTLLSGNSFGLIFGLRDGEFNEIFMFGSVVDKEVKRLVGFPPILGKVRNIECSFSDSTAWVFISAEWNSQMVRYVLVVTSNGELYAMGAAKASSGVWHSEGVPRAAYHRRVGVCSERGLVALVDGKLIKVVSRDLEIKVVCHETHDAAAKSNTVVADGNQLVLQRVV